MLLHKKRLVLEKRTQNKASRSERKPFSHLNCPYFVRLCARPLGCRYLGNSIFCIHETRAAYGDILAYSYRNKVRSICRCRERSETETELSFRRHRVHRVSESLVKRNGVCKSLGRKYDGRLCAVPFVYYVSFGIVATFIVFVKTNAILPRFRLFGSLFSAFGRLN